MSWVDVRLTTLSVSPGSPLTDLLGPSVPDRGSIAEQLALAPALGSRLPRPGEGRTRELWEALATLGATDLQLARAIEPHLDALAVLRESGAPMPARDTTWGVFASESGSARLEATQKTGGEDDRWVLDGTKPWCSLADRLTHALVTAWVDPMTRGLFAVDLRRPGVRTSGGDWVAHGLPGIRSVGLELDGVEATAVGGPGWYLRRPGFAYGAMGVAAIWYGGAVGLARRLAQPPRSATARPLDQLGHAHLGAVDAALWAARAVLAEAATAVDAGAATGADGWTLALRVRQVVADAAELVLTRTAHALGPGPLVGEDEHAARVADLGLYLRQHHAERDQAALGARVLDALQEGGTTSPW